MNEVMNAFLEKFFEVSLSFLAVITFYLNGLWMDQQTNPQMGDNASYRDARCATLFYLVGLDLTELN